MVVNDTVSALHNLYEIETVSQQEIKQSLVSIGILAFNEASQISRTLESLFNQSLFQNPSPHRGIEIVVVPNGCTDSTAAIACATLQELAGQCDPNAIRWRVCEVEQPGKCNAWNFYVSKFSDASADYLFLMDADIEFRQPDTLENMLDTLENSPEAWVSVDKPIKDIFFKNNKSLMEWFSILIAMSGSNSGPAGICGQLYCAKAAMLRRISLPVAMQGEDGFLATMIRTAGFTSPDVSDRIVRAPEASHVFEAYTDLNRLLRHERWIVLFNTIDWFLCSYLSANCNSQLDAGSLIKQRNEENPLWLHEIIQTAVSEKGWWVIPNWLVFRRWRSLQYKGPLKAIILIPVVAIAFLADLLICYQANLELKSGGGMGYWGKTQKS